MTAPLLLILHEACNTCTCWRVAQHFTGLSFVPMCGYMFHHLSPVCFFAVFEDAECYAMTSTSVTAPVQPPLWSKPETKCQATIKCHNTGTSGSSGCCRATISYCARLKYLPVWQGRLRALRESLWLRRWQKRWFAFSVKTLFPRLR